MNNYEKQLPMTSMKIFAGKAFVQVQAFFFFRTSFQKVEFAQFHNLGWVTVMWKRASFWTFWTFSEHKLFANSEFFFIIFLAISITSRTMFSPFLTSATFIFGTWSFSEKIRMKKSLYLLSILKIFQMFWAKTSTRWDFTEKQVAVLHDFK